MKTFARNLSLARLILMAGASVLSVCHWQARAAGIDATFAAIPREVQKGGTDYGGDATDDPTVLAFSDFSWRSFIAVNWPATDWPTHADRGLPDTSKDFSDLSRPRVWETWKAGFETIPKQPASGLVVSPLIWNEVRDLTPIGGSTLNHPKVFGSYTPFGDISQADFASPSAGPHGALASPLVCMNHTYTHFEVHVNRAEYATLLGEGFYLRENIDAHISSDSHEDFQFPHGSITVKAAWRELLPSDDASTYYVRDADVTDYSTATPTSTTKRLGLVGLHIVHKTPLRKQWIWTSFEHAKNVPGLGGASPFSYNDGTASGLTQPPPDAVNSGNYVTPTPNAALAPVQVIRLNNLHSQATAVNATYHAMLPSDSVWRNYFLVLTQWPTTPDEEDEHRFPPEPTGGAQDLNVSNMTLETWHQGTSCIGCHELAEEAGFDYVFFPAVHAQNTPGAPVLNEPSAKLIGRIRERVNSSQDRSKKLFQLRNNR